MFAMTGVTGQVGGVAARALLAAGEPVRAVVRDPAKGAAWAQQGCEIAVADMRDAAALTRAFDGAHAVFVLLPPVFDPSPGYPESRAAIAALKDALSAARPARVVCLSTIGAQATQDNLLQQLSVMERELATLPMPVAFLRAAWFMENAAWDVAAAMADGEIASFLYPLDRPVPMVATADVGRVAASLLRDTWNGVRVVELEGPRRTTPNDIADAFSRVLGKPVTARVVPRETWETLFRAQGMRHPQPRIRMLDGFNEGWIEFAAPAGTVKGTVPLETVLRGLVERASREACEGFDRKRGAG